MRNTIQGHKAATQLKGVHNIVELELVKRQGGDGVGIVVKVTEGNMAGVVIASANGKQKVFANVDDVIKTMADYSLLENGAVTYTITNPEFLNAKPYTGDPIVKATKDMARAVVQRDKATDAAAVLTTGIAVMPQTNSAEIALVTERTEQRDAVSRTAAYYEAERARIALALGL